MQRNWIIVFSMTTALLAAPAFAVDSLDSLKERFKKRYPTLVKLRDAGKAGETDQGFAGAVKSSYRDEKTGSGDQTVGAFLDEENSDRRKLYKIIAEKDGSTAEKTAERNAQRNFRKAKDEHYLQKKGTWKKKKDW